EFVVRLPLLSAESVDAAAAGVPAESREQSNRVDVRAAGRVLPIGGALAVARDDHPSGSGAAKAATKHRRILVADDNTDAAIAIAEILGTIGHQVRTAEDGLEAIELAESFRPDLILLDIGMPRLDGYEACRRIRQRPWGRD